MNLSERLCVDKELFSGERSSYENTMNLSERLCVDKELFSGERSSYENTILSKHTIITIILSYFIKYDNIYFTRNIIILLQIRSII